MQFFLFHRFIYRNIFQSRIFSSDSSSLSVLNRFKVPAGSLSNVDKEVVKFLTTLEDKTLYSLLPVCSYFNDNNSLVYKSIFKEKVVITKDTLVSQIECCGEINLLIVATLIQTIRNNRTKPQCSVREKEVTILK